jgi:hypothetical protein
VVFTMRFALIALALSAMSARLAADPASGEPVYLDGPSALARLEARNPDHYARAARILASANHLCREGRPGLQHAGADLRSFTCGMLLRTSNPPKRRISFRLDDTRYVALVTITDDAPRVIPAR